MSKRPPNDPTPIPKKPFESENVMAEEKTRQLKRNREECGGLSDEPKDDPVKNSKPYRALS